MLRIISNKDIAIKNQNLKQSTTDKIVIKKDVNTNITFAGVKIDVSGVKNKAALKIEDNREGNVIITLAERTKNILKSENNCAGLQKNGYGEKIGKLEIKETKKLEAEGGKYGAGIGSGFFGAGSNITISVRKVTGGRDGIKIGGGKTE